MEGEGRSYLSGSILLSRNKDGSAPEEYIVKSVIGKGGAAVCYEAVRILKNGIAETGKLKEFYPVDAVAGSHAWYYSLERLPDGQLVPGTGTVRRFDEMCEEYLDTYRLLRKVMADQPHSEILKSYIQCGEILYGLSDPGAADDGTERRRRATVYIWSPGVPGKGFDVYLSELRKQPAKRPEDWLYEVLNVVDEVTDCIKALHTAGLMHLDIKPSNFLVQYNSDYKIHPNRISMFDISTLCSADSERIRVCGTEGFCAPEVLRGRADHRSDLYSIGAMLFYALVITPEIPDGLYRPAFYDRIPSLIKQSALFRASEIISDSALLSGICRILEKCLAFSPAARYQSCSELRADLTRVTKRLQTLRHAPTQREKTGLADPTLVMQKLLYEHPLYETEGDGDDLHVLVIGAGAYGQSFINVCLQAGQMSGVRLHITAVSDRPEEDRENYLRFRPALREFVNINGSQNGRKEPAYASLDFRGVSKAPENGEPEARFRRNTQKNRELVEALLGEAVLENREYHYIFIALGEDRINRSIARLCARERRDLWDRSCPVCYVSQKKRAPGRADAAEKLYPVCVNEPVETAAIDRRLGEMAFNAHIAWKDSLNFDLAEERRRFFESGEEEDRYNRRSSLSFALSIKYKLRSVQIESSDPLQAAVQFSEQILQARRTDQGAQKKFDRLVDLEHRRWLLDRAAEGWTAPRDENGCLRLEDCVIRGSVKDPVNRTHPCMVRGSETSPLRSPEYEADHHAKWEEGEIDPNLDELDRMSVELHRCFRRHAEQYKREGIYQDADLKLIQSLIPENCTEAGQAFQQFQYALKNMLNGVESYCRQYDSYQKAFTDTLDSLPKEARARIRERLAAVALTFFPVRESCLYRNYKANDETLIEKIPFILTYRHAPALAMAFEDGRHQNGRTEAVFANVASATVLNPRKISYLYCFGADSDADLLLRKLDAVLNYLNRRKIHAGVELIAACLKEVSGEKQAVLLKELGRLRKRHQPEDGAAWLEKEKLFSAADYEEAAGGFQSCLEECRPDLYDGGTLLFPSVYDNAALSGRIRQIGIPWFELDWRTKTFTKTIGCEYLKFVRDASFLRIRDMFALMNAADHRFHFPEFAGDYEELWRIYTGEYLSVKKFETGVSSWNRLCMSLEEYEKEQKPMAKIALCKEDRPQYKMLCCFLPEYTYQTVKRLLRQLIEAGAAGKQSGVFFHASDTCRLELWTEERYEKALSGVFENPQLLLPHYGIEIRKYRAYNTDYVEIRCSSLTVTDANLDPDGKGRYEESLRVLRQLEKAHFVSQVRQNPENPALVSFSYSSSRIRKLLTCAGEILEVYAYYDVLKTGYFDDVACGYEFSWESGGVKNELDLVLTKGFRSMFVECKAVVELQLDYYHKLHSIAGQFGIGTIKVMIGNTYARSNTEANEKNTMQRSRGSQLQIRTVSGESQILHIGETLRQMMEGG